MKNNIILMLFLFLLLSIAGYGQILRTMVSEDTVCVHYNSGFNYDVILLYANGVKVDERILYSRNTTGDTRNGIKLGYKSDSVQLTVFYFQRNEDFSLEYNALWYQWQLYKDENWICQLSRILS